MKFQNSPYIHFSENLWCTDKKFKCDRKETEEHFEFIILFTFIIPEQGAQILNR